MHNNNLIVHGLWIGKQLSPIELLCIQSFLAHGHEFHLWHYDDLQTHLPNGAIAKNASEIIPKEHVFCYNYGNDFGHGKGSYAGFSDIFRYKLLYEKGGWWSDMDMICLKPLYFEEDFVFRTHHNFPVVGNIMKCPRGSALMLNCYNEAIQKVNADNTDWHLPLKILNKHIDNEGLKNCIKEISNQDNWVFVKFYLLFNIKPKKNWHVIHLMNEEWRNKGISKERLPTWGFVGRMLRHYDIYPKRSFIENLKNFIKFTV